MLGYLFGLLVVICSAYALQIGTVRVVKATGGDYKALINVSTFVQYLLPELFFLVIPIIMVMDGSTENKFALWVTLAGLIVFSTFLICLHYRHTAFFIGFLLYTVLALRSAYKMYFPQNLDKFALIAFVAFICLALSIFCNFFSEKADLRTAAKVPVPDDVSEYIDGMNRVVNITLFTTLLVFEAAIAAVINLLQLLGKL